MTARSSALAILLLAAACTPAPQPVPAAVITPPQEYTCDQESRAGDEYRALGTGSMLRVMVDDYGVDRRERRRLLGLPDPPACPPHQAQARVG